MGKLARRKLSAPEKASSDAGPAGLHQQRGGDAVARRHASEHESLLEMLGVALPESDAGGLLRGIVEQPAHLLGVQIGRAAGRSGCAEAFGEAVRVAVRCVHEVLAAKRHGNARADVIAESDGAQKLRPADAESFSRRQRRGHHGAARMRQRRRVRIVGFVGLREHAIGERGFDRPAEDIRADHRGDFFAAVRPRELNGGATGGKIGTGDHGGERIEEVILHLLDNFFRERTRASLAHVGAEPKHGRAYFFGAPSALAGSLQGSGRRKRPATARKPRRPLRRRSASKAAAGRRWLCGRYAASLEDCIAFVCFCLSGIPTWNWSPFPR